jgi:hypothetical protein
MAGEGDSLRKVVKGDPLRVSHETFNSFIDAARDYRQRQQSQDSKAEITNLGPGECYIQNNTDLDLPQFAVVGLDVPVILPADNLPGFYQHVLFRGITPSGSAIFAILQEPCAKLSVARAVVSGVTPVLLNVGDESHTYADVDTAADDPTVDLITASTSTAAQILWKESGTGTGIRAVVRLANGVVAAGTGIYKVLMLIDDLNPGSTGWEYPRAHTAL